MSDQPYIKHPVVYGHPNDPDFETDCPIRAQAYGAVYPSIEFMRRRLQESGRYKTTARLEGQLKRDVQLLVEWECSKATGRHEWDFMGIKGKLDEPKDGLIKDPHSDSGYIGTRDNRGTYDGMDADE